ncbi:restriction endonuclease subunit S [Nesterenkonia flava]|uniref:Restriction endonuclease subunit S n=1 Tax=Nesterenkonia flava TaxID=469799 RepID=A0ABU1FVM4_9MICC|nr:restriction endonuclease subunit S [Nesterenkonia flava]MDR5712724.1 restriction endonuclease subunit S [Nesterenkonia flava]
MSSNTATSLRVGDVLEEFKEAAGTANNDVPVLTLTERNGFVRQSDRFNKRLATEDTSKYKVIRRNDVAFNPYLLWAGAIAQNDRFDTGVISPLYPTFRIRNGFDPAYIKHMLLSSPMVSRYDTIAFGSVPRRRRSSVKDFLNLELPAVPPLEEQRRIATILDRAKDIENLSKARDVHYSQLEENLHISTVGTPEAPIGDAYTVSFGELIKVSSGKFLPSHAMDPGGTHLVYGGNGANGFHNEYMFDSPTVVIGRVGAYCGAVHLTEPKSWVSDNALYVKSTSKEMDAIFLSASLRRAHLNQFANKSGQPSISAGKISHAPILVAPMELQKQFAQKIAATRALHSKTALSHQHMVQLTSSLQSRAFRGEL